MALLEAHQSHNRIACGKATQAQRAELCLAVAAVLIAAVALIQLVAKLFPAADTFSV
jgi:hypothetical protein